MELLRIGKDKRALKFVKKRVRDLSLHFRSVHCINYCLISCPSLTLFSGCTSNLCTQEYFANLIPPNFPQIKL